MKCVCGHSREKHEGRPPERGGTIKDLLDPRCREWGCKCQSYDPPVPDMPPLDRDR